MPDFSTYIDIDPSEYISECSRSEIKEVIDCLVEDGHLNTFNGKIHPKDNTPMDDEWEDMLLKLKDSRHLLSSEDESVIIEISKKMV